MTRAPWRRRRTGDPPRPAGRRWAGRLRRGGVFARQVLRARPRLRGGNALAVDTYPVTRRRRGLRTAELPALPATGLAAAPAQPALAGAPARLLPGDRTVARQLGFLLVNFCTLISLSLGVLAILLAMRGDVRAAAACLLVCVVIDGLDGVLARRFGVASPFGAQMDSMADMCAFGIAAPVVVYAMFQGSVYGGYPGTKVAQGVPAAGAAAACALVAACAAIRLARFNVTQKDSRYFTGVPTTLAAAVLAVLVLIGLPVPPAALLVGVVLVAFAMVSPFPYATMGRLLRLPPWLWLAPAAGFVVDPRLTFVALVVIYMASGPVLWFHQRRMAPAA